jgi:hypothetical protein
MRARSPRRAAIRLRGPARGPRARAVSTDREPATGAGVARDQHAGPCASMPSTVNLQRPACRPATTHRKGIPRQTVGHCVVEWPTMPSTYKCLRDPTAMILMPSWRPTSGPMVLVALVLSSVLPHARAARGGPAHPRPGRDSQDRRVAAASPFGHRWHTGWRLGPVGSRPEPWPAWAP